MLSIIFIDQISFYYNNFQISLFTKKFIVFKLVLISMAKPKLNKLIIDYLLSV